MEETKIALVGILVEELAAAEKVNAILHGYAGYIVGRMGIPYREKGVSVISVVLDAPRDVVSALSGKLGMLPGVTAKTMTSKAPAPPRED